MPRNFGIIDLFAGPGGLGEGFSAAGRETHSRMDVLLSVEKEATEVRTLRLRAFLRDFEEGFPREYYEALNRGAAMPDWSELYPGSWQKAQKEARQLTLGAEGTFEEIAAVLDRAREAYHGDTILIGGPPCQAYSLVGRARNKGKADYVAEEDGRHFLYREYVRILDRLRPAAFVMENVKGLLSSKVSGDAIFHRVLDDLSNAGDGYVLLPLANPVVPGQVAAEDFLVRAEEHGIPQTRHRVFVVGLRRDVRLPDFGAPLLKKVERQAQVSVATALHGLPDLRSGLSKTDSLAGWRRAVMRQAAAIARDAATPRDLRDYVAAMFATEGALPVVRQSSDRSPFSKNMPEELAIWLGDRSLKVALHHETRSHIEEDLGRYVFAASSAAIRGVSPKLRDFPESLQPEHRSRGTGAFEDRFRVQVAEGPANTITSHISKDGHYYIHPDPRQARSFTVREAARMQTFPDNYFFFGGRTAQYHQVGNAVPPYLALQIGRAIRRLLTGK